MKKLLAGLMVLGFLLIGVQQAHASILRDGCSNGEVYSSTTGQQCPTDYSCSNGEVYSSTTGQQCPTSNRSITVLSPNGGETYEAGDKVTIRWKTMNAYNPNTQVSIMDDRIPDWQTLSLFGSAPALDYAKYVSASGNGGNTEYTYEYTFTVPSTFNDSLPSQYQNIYGGKHYKILVNIVVPRQVGIASQQILEDLSDKTFTINSSMDNGCSNGEVYSSTTGQKCPTTAPSITVLSPNGGEKVDLNTPFTIKWNTKGLDPTSLLGISIAAYKTRNDAVNNNELNSVGTTVLNSVRAGAGQASVILGSENLTIIPMINEGINFDNVKLEIFNWEPYHTISDTSDFPFSIISNPALIPSITVLSPNGGETYKPYDQINVKWKSKNIDSNRMVNVYLSAPDQSDDIPLISNTPNDGVQGTVITPEQLMKKPGVTSFKILVVSSGVNDFSDNYFTIGSSTEDGCKNGEVYSSTTGQKCPTYGNGLVNLIYPKSSSVLKAGQSINVRWDTGEISAINRDIELEIKHDGIKVYGFALSNDGQEELNIPLDIPTGKYDIQFATTGVNGYSFKDYQFATFYIIPKVDNGCLPGHNFSSTTGLACNGAVDPGCLPGYNFSSTTGQACINIINTDTTHRTLKLTNPRMTGEDIMVLQRFLSIYADGVYGYGTMAKVKEWQRNNGLYPDGAVGAQTRSRMGL